MNTLQRFLDDNRSPFEFKELLSEDLEKMEAATPPSSVFKYCPASRCAFFENPTFRFTQRTSLNDPFELSKRWKEFLSSDSRELMAAHVKGTIERLLGNKGVVLAILKEEFASRGIFLSPDQVAVAAANLLSREGASVYRNAVFDVLSQTEVLTRTALELVNSGADAAFEKLASEIGIFSLTDSANNEQMWGLYGDSGMGFVVELDAHHDFFKASNGRNLLRQVLYTDRRLSSFIENPLYLFLVKGEKWAFEQEWRLIKMLSDCDLELLSDRGSLFLCRVPSGLVRSVIFGYNYSTENLARNLDQIKNFDSSIGAKRAFIDNDKGVIDVRELEDGAA